MPPENSTEQLPVRSAQPVKHRWRHLLFRSSSVGPVLTLLYAAGLPGLIYWITGTANGITSDQFTLTTIIICTVAYFACGMISLRVLEFGNEIDIFSIHRFQRLWRLSVRYSALWLVLMFLLTPLFTAFLVRDTFAGHWAGTVLFSFDMFLLQILFGLLAVINRVGRTPKPVRIFLLYIIFPLRHLGRLLRWSVLLILLWPLFARFYLRFGGVEAMMALDSALQQLMHFSGIGPFLVYVINPVYLLLDMVRQHPGQANLAGFGAFACVTLASVVVSMIHLRRTLWGDWSALPTEFYDYWTGIRDQVLNDVIASLPSDSSNLPAGNDYPSDQDDGFPAQWINVSPGSQTEAAHYAENPNDASRSVPNIPNSSPEFSLPVGITGEEFIAGLIKPEPLLTRFKLVILAITASTSLFRGDVGLVAVGLVWLAVTSDYLLPYNFNSWITPQNPWRYIRITLRRQALYVLGDAVFAVVCWLILPINWVGALLLIALLVGLRLLMLPAKLAYYMQSRRTVLIIVFAALLYIPMGIMAVGSANEEIESTMAGLITSLAATAVVWIALAWEIIWFHGNLAHYDTGRNG